MGMQSEISPERTNMTSSGRCYSPSEGTSSGRRRLKIKVLGAEGLPIGSAHLELKMIAGKNSRRIALGRCGPNPRFFDINAEFVMTRRDLDRPMQFVMSAHPTKDLGVATVDLNKAVTTQVVTQRLSLGISSTLVVQLFWSDDSDDEVDDDEVVRVLVKPLLRV